MEIIAKNIRCLYPEMVYYGEIVTDNGIFKTRQSHSVEEARKLRNTLEVELFGKE